MVNLVLQHISIIIVSQRRGGKLLSITISVFGTLQRSGSDRIWLQNFPVKSFYQFLAKNSLQESRDVYLAI